MSVLSKSACVLCAPLAAVALLAAPAAAGAATLNWKGGSGNWNDPDNWQEAAVPQAGDSVVFTAETTPIAVTNDIEGLELVTLTLATVDNAAPIVLAGEKLTFTSAGTAWSAAVAFTNAMPLVFAHNLTPTKTHTVVASKGGVFLGDFELNGDCSIAAGGRDDAGLATKIYGAVTGTDSILYPTGNHSVYFYAPVRVKGILLTNWVTYEAYFHAAGNEWRTNDISFSSKLWAKTANAFPTNLVMRWTERRPDSDQGSEKSTYAALGEQTIDRMESEPIKGQKSGVTCDKFHLGCEWQWDETVFHMRATASASCAAKIWPKISIDYDPLGDFTQTFRDREHSANRTLTVRRGTLESLGANTFKSVTGLTVCGAGTFKVSADENGTAVNPFGTETVAEIRFGGALDVVSGVTVTLKTLLANGVIVPVGTYQGADGTDDSATRVSWIRGGGLVQVLNVESATCWTEAVSGAWDDAANWSAGVPSAGTKTYVTADGADYTVTVPSGTVLPKTLTIRNDVGRSTVDMASDATLTEWNWSVAGGGEFRVSGGEVVFTNNTSVATFAVSGEDSRTGRVAVVAGTFRYAPVRSSSPIQLLTGGRIDVSGGVFDLPTLLSNPGENQQLVQKGGILSVTGGEFRNQGERSGWRVFAENGTTLSGASVFSVLSTHVTVRPTAAGETARLAFSDTARQVEYGSSLQIGGCAGGRAVLDLNSEAIHGGLYEGSLAMYRTILVGVNEGTGEMNVSAGYVSTHANGLDIGTSDDATKTTAGVKGIVRVSGGVLYVRASNNFYGWAGDRLTGLAVGYGAYTAVREGLPYEGELYISGGAVTNAYGPTVVGMGYARGAIEISGGTYRAQTLSEIQPTILGMGGGSGSLVLSGGSFLSPRTDAPVYVGGCETNVFGSYSVDFPATGYPIDRHDAVGALTISGGTFSVASDVVLGADGQGTFERIGSSGTVTIAGDFVFSNTVANASSGGTLVFRLDEAGNVGPIAVGGKLRLDAKAKIVIDTGSGEVEGLHSTLLTAKGGIEGNLADGAVVFTGARAAGAKLRRTGGTLKVVRSAGCVLVIR